MTFHSQLANQNWLSHSRRIVLDIDSQTDAPNRESFHCVELFGWNSFGANNSLSLSLKKEVIDRNTDPANMLLLDGT